MKKPESRARQTTAFVLQELLGCLQQNVPEKLIQERTGHRSTTALRMYERTSSQQQMSVSSIIASAAPKNFVPEIPLPLTGPEQTSSKCAKSEESKVAFDSCQNCTINVNIQYAGPSTN